MQWPPPAHHLVITALTMKDTASIERMCDINFFLLLAWSFNNHPFICGPRTKMSLN